MQDLTTEQLLEAIKQANQVIAAEVANIAAAMEELERRQ